MKRSALDAMLNAGVLLVYYLAAKVGLSLAIVDEAATAVWPPTGIALTAALLLGRRIWPGIWAGAFLANYSIAPLHASAGIATGNLLEAIVGAGLINQFAGGKSAFDRAGDIFRFVLYAGFIATAVSATIGTSVLELA